MGSNTSKPGEQICDKKKIDINEVNNSDPRSPTPEIIRTPLNDKTGNQHNITKNVDLRKTFENVKNEEKLIHNNPILSAVIKNHLQSYDPRSPTQDFERTPIVITEKNDILYNSGNCYSENSYGSPSLLDDKLVYEDSIGESSSCPDLMRPKNLCHEFLDMTLKDSLKDTEEPLGSSTASNEAVEDNVSNATNPTKLLETNFDYVDCDSSMLQNNVEPVIETNKLDNFGNSQKHIALFKILDNDPRSPSVGIERTPIVVPKVADLCEDNVEHMSDDILIKALQTTNVELKQICMAQNKMAEGVLIYEDKTNNTIETPKKPKSECNNGSRTPLSCMKNKTDTTHARSKSVNTLIDCKEQKIATKIPKRVSHIPRLKSLSNKSKHISTCSVNSINKTSAISGDCENTPPHSHRDKWDKDNSIVL